MKRFSLGPEFLSAFLSLLILVAGGLLIRAKLQDRPSMQADLILTADEQRALPAGVMPVVLMRTNPSNDQHSLRYLMLVLILSRSGEKYSLGYGETYTDPVVALQHISASKSQSPGNPSGLTVGLFGSNVQGVLLIPTPVDGGLLGLRVSCINVKDLDRFKSVKNVQNLRPYLAIQGRGWNDARFFTDSGLPTYESTVSVYLNLLDQGRVDYSPRDLVNLEEECGPRVGQAGYTNIAIDPHLLIAYPNAFVFGIHPGNTRLKAALERGLKRAIADGSQQRLLQQRFFTPWLKRNLRLRERRLLVLSTPATEALLKESPPSSWLVPWQRLPRSSDPPVSAAILCQEPFFAPLC